MLASTAAPPKSAPMATAAVGTGAALVWLLLTELTAELAELVRLAISELMEARPEPVAVERTDDRLERRLLSSPVMELSWDDAAELMDERIELAALVREAAGPTVLVADGPLAVVVTVTWACLEELAGCANSEAGQWETRPSGNIPQPRKRRQRGW